MSDLSCKRARLGRLHAILQEYDAIDRQLANSTDESAWHDLAIQQELLGEDVWAVVIEELEETEQALGAPFSDDFTRMLSLDLIKRARDYA